MRNWNNKFWGGVNMDKVVLSLPMRNWNSSWNCSLSSKDLVLSLPMRNWNMACLMTAKDLFYVLSLPMRNWNTKCSTSDIMDDIVLSLPMRNWNGCRMSHMVEGYACVLSLPMRNWNARFRSLSSSVEFGFESTYEELKPSELSVSTLCNLTFWVYLWGIETCYKTIYLLISINVLSLPMRNWNYLMWRNKKWKK